MCLGDIDRHARRLENQRRLLEAKGFVDIEVTIVDAPLHMPSAEECARFQREAFAGLDQLLAALPKPDRDDTWREVAEALKSLAHDGSFQSDARFIVGSGSRP
jgi:hypothetical protein